MSRIRNINKSLLKDFLECEKGANAIEFAIVAPLFLAIVLSILELGFIFLVDLSVENALHATTRLVRTGQAQTAAMTPEQFRQRICDNANALINCPDLRIDLKELASFGEDNGLPAGVDVDGNFTNDTLFETGAPNSIVVARSMYRYQVKTPLGISDILLKNSANGYMMQHISAFKNEPF